MTTSFPLDLRTEFEIAGAWTDATSKVYQRDGSSPPVTIERGRGDETSQLNASSSAFEVNNRAGQFSPKNPLSPWYGSFSRNTPVRHSIPAQASYLRLEAGSANRAYVNDTAALHVTGSIEMRIALELTDWQGCVLAAKWDGGGCWLWILEPSGALTFTWADSGAVQHSVSSPPVFWRGTAALRVTMDATTGNVAFYRAATIDGTYTQVGVTVSGTGGASTSIFSSSSSALVVGWSLNGAGFTPPVGQACGRVAEYRLYNGIGGTVVADTVMSGVTAGATTWTDGRGLTWLLAGGAEVSSRDYRYHGECSALPPKWDNSGNDQSVNVTAGGAWRRLGQGQTPAQSPMRRALTTQPGTLAPVAYWTWEDPAGATTLGSASGGVPMQFDGAPVLATDSSFLASMPLPQLGGGRFTGQVLPYSGAGSIVVRFLMKLGTAPASTTTLVRLVTSGTVPVVDLQVTPAGDIQLASSGGAFSVGPLTSPAGGGSWAGQEWWMSIELRPSGSSMTVALVSLAPDGGTAYGGVYATLASTSPGNLRNLYVNPYGGFTDTVMGHFSVQADWETMFALQQPLDAWAGETAGARFARLCSEEGIAARVIGSPGYSAAMGPQGTDTPQNLLQGCEDADQGQLFEPRQILGLGYRTCASMCNQSPRVTADYSQSQLGGTTGGSGTGLLPTLDDSRLRNDWTVTRGSPGGAQGMTYQAVLDDGSAESVSEGDYSDSLTANVEDDAMVPNLAGWKVHAGTSDEYRWPAIPFNLRRPAIQNASLYYPLLSLDVGDHLELSNMPNVVLYDPVRQLAWGLRESLGGMHHQLEVNGVPESTYEVIILDDPAYGRADTDGSQLALAASSSATALTVISGLGPQWTQDGGDFPFDVNIGGERCTVTSVNAGITGLTQVGAWLDGTALGTTGWTAAYSAWQSITGVNLSAGRWYAGTSYMIGTTLSQMISAGVRILLDIAPTTANPTDFAGIQSFLAALQAAGADVRVSLFHEPFNGGLSASQFQALFAYYGPMIRSYYPLYAVLSNNDSVVANGYYPPAGSIDGLAADQYATGLDWLDNVAAVADSYGLPLGLWEMNGPSDFGMIDNGTASPVSGITLSQSQAWFASIISFFAARLAAGQLNGDIAIFSGGGSVGSGTGTGNFLGSALSANGGFEGSLGTWVAGGTCTAAQTTAQAHSGTGSMALTCTTAGTIGAGHCTTANVTTQGMPVTPGQLIGFSGWFRPGSTTRTVQAGVSFYTSAGVFISNAFAAGVAETGGAWKFSGGTATVPATAAFAKATPQLTSAALGEVHYLDDMQIGTFPSGSTDHTSPLQYPWDYRVAQVTSLVAALANTSPPQVMTVTRSGNGVVKPQSAGTDVRLWFPPILAWQ